MSTTELLERDLEPDHGSPTPESPDRRRKAIAAGSALVVALMAGIALAYFLTSEGFSQQVTGDALEVSVDGLDNMFDGDGVQPGRVLSGAFTAANTNDVPIEYTMLAEPDAGNDADAMEQYSNLEVRLCSEEESGFLFMESTDTSCGDWQDLDGLELDLGAYDPGDESEMGLELRLKETGEEQPDDATTDWDFIVEAKSDGTD